MVRVKGLEPPRIAAPDPKSGVSTNSTTLALNRLRYDTCQTLSSGFESRAFIAIYVAGRYSEKENLEFKSCKKLLHQCGVCNGQR